MWTVWVLLWKRMIVRKRKLFLTIYDYFAPVLVFTLLYIATLKTRDSSKFEDFHNTEPLSYDELLRKHERGSILYAPETPFTNQLMDKVGAKMDLKRLNHLPRDEETGYFPFSNESALTIMLYSKHNMTTEDAIVIFHVQDSDIFPKKLNYTIRMKHDFLTDEFHQEDLFSYLPFGIPLTKGLGTPYEAFIRLQWAIDSSYLYMLTGQDVGQVMSLQELPSPVEEKNKRAMVVAVVASFFLPFALVTGFIFLAERLYEGKNTGMDELLKMVGVSWEDLTLSRVLDMTPHMLIYAVGGTLFFVLFDFLPHTNGGFILVAMVLHFYSVVALAFVVVYVFDILEHMQIVAGSLYFILIILSIIQALHVEIKALAILISLLIPPSFFVRFWISIARKEYKGISVSMSNMWSLDHVTRERTTIAEDYIFMLLQIFILATMAWYLSRVHPGKYGQALPWNFPFKNSSKPSMMKIPPADSQAVSEDDKKYFEQAPPGLPVGIQISNVYKSFGADVVLHGVTLAVYRGEITVLLGHNGAGKTTLINTITGLVPATSGYVLVEGKDTLMQAKEVRKLIGYCPQENLLYPDLTVLQHTMLYAMLKGKSYSQARSAALELFSLLQLSDKAGARTSQLSGGMLRRTQLACAIVGGSRVLLLDEPTSGLDVESRHELWDIIMGLRGNRTVLLTTHFMEEADALGDRITVLHHGRVKCHATAMFLKRAIGSGYSLSLTTAGAPKEAEITSTITAIVPEAAVTDRRPSGLSYSLPAHDSACFPELFAALEERRAELHIEIIGVGKSSLDEVFVKLCSDEELSYLEDLGTMPVERKRTKHTETTLFMRQWATLSLRHWYYMLTNCATVLMIAILVWLLFWLCTEIGNNRPFGISEQTPQKTVTLDLDLYIDPKHRHVFVHADKDTVAVLRTGFSQADFVEVSDVSNATYQTGHIQKYIVGIELSDVSAKALYVPSLRHAAPVALNTLSNALAARLTGAHGAPRMLSVRSHPLLGAYVPYEEQEIRPTKEDEKIKLWAAAISMMYMLAMTTMLGLPCLERVTGMRHTFVLASAPRALIWGAAMFAHLARMILFYALPVIVLTAALDRDDTFFQAGFLLAVLVVLALGTVAYFSFMYFVSTFFSRRVTSMVTLIFVYVFTSTVPRLIDCPRHVFSRISYVLVPPHTLYLGMIQTGRIARMNAHCRLNRDKCPTLDGPEGFEAKTCCESSSAKVPWSYGASGVLDVTLVGQFIVYFMLTLLSDNGRLAALRERCTRKPRPPPLRHRDPAAEAEAAYVAKTITMNEKKIPDAILVHKLQKVYSVGCRKPPLFAVRDLSFSVKKGECFGLLGVNGAGKTTTFGILTAKKWPTRGDIYANGYRWTHWRRKHMYMQSFSYCPQFDGIDNFLTGRQNLTQLLTIRGMRNSDVVAVSDYWLQEVELTAVADRRVSSYSGGMARRLAAAAALCQAAHTTVLDEPTDGVDPLARRRMHVAFMRAKQNRSIIIASHNLYEIETLCDRIAILSGGELRALGSPAELKMQYGQGYSVVFKLVVSQDAEGTATLDEFKRELHERFDGELRDQHLGMMSYHLNETVPYSELFTQLEDLRGRFPTLLEDYTVTETTLEEVFLALAREARQGLATPSASDSAIPGVSDSIAPPARVGEGDSEGVCGSDLECCWRAR